MNIDINTISLVAIWPIEISTAIANGELKHLKRLHLKSKQDINWSG
jgi:hypothetical protein